MTEQTGRTSCGVVMWSTDEYIGADKETKGGQCQINVTLWIVWNDGFDQKCEGMVQKRRASRGVVLGVLRMGVVESSGGQEI